MKIDAVHLINIDMLLRRIQPLIEEGLKTNNVDRPSFSTHINSVYSNIYITMDLSELTSYEVFALKKYLSKDIIVTDKYYSDDERFSFLPDNNVCKANKELYDIVSQMNEDTDINPKPGNILFTTGTIIENCIITLNGPILANIFTLKPEVFFINLQKKYFSEYLFEDSIKEEKYFEIVNECVAEKFIDSFMQYLVSSNDVDLYSDSTIDSEYFSYADKTKGTVLNYIKAPNSIINFTNTDEGTLSKEISSVKEYLSKLNISVEDKLSSLEASFTVTSSLLTFLNLYQSLPFGCIPDYQNIRIILSDKSELIYSSNWRKYKIRYSSRASTILKERDKLINSKSHSLERYSFIPLNNRITYIIKTDFLTIGKLINSYNSSELLSYNNIEEKNIYNNLSIVKSIYQMITE